MCFIDFEPTFYYYCFYCKKGFSIEKDKLKIHWAYGDCKSLREGYSTRLIVQPHPFRFCKVFLNPQNVDMDLVILGLVLIFILLLATIGKALIKRFGIRLNLADTE